MAKKLPTEVLEWFRAQGAKGGAIGGSKGGKTAMAKLTPEERSARAKHAVTIREAKRAASKRKATVGKKTRVLGHPPGSGD